jgi:hypothetical protein
MRFSFGFDFAASAISSGRKRLKNSEHHRARASLRAKRKERS